jgi:hypothetical protein
MRLNPIVTARSRSAAGLVCHDWGE